MVLVLCHYVLFQTFFQIEKINIYNRFLLNKNKYIFT